MSVSIILATSAARCSRKISATKRVAPSPLSVAGPTTSTGTVTLKTSQRKFCLKELRPSHLISSITWSVTLLQLKQLYKVQISIPWSRILGCIVVHRKKMAHIAIIWLQWLYNR